MKTKLVLWGKTGEEQRVLAAIELKAEENRVGTYIFPQEIITDEFTEKMMQEWRNNKEVAFPEGFNYSETALSVTESIIPKHLEMERPDLLTRAQTEWHFVVLSSKLHDVYKSELSDIKDKINQLEKYDSKLWEQLKGYWNKVRQQIKDQNLFKEHADELQSGVNEAFDSMKQMRAKLEEQYQARSVEFKQQFMEQLNEIDKQIQEGGKLGMVFDELKKLQRKFRETKFTKEDREKIWQRLDGAFKNVKEKRFGPETNTDNSALGRLERRLGGLENAMDRMQKSIQRDRDDLGFQERKIARTDGQLEAQIRQAKIKMIEERVRSKQERLDDMEKTKEQILKQIEKQKQRDEKRAEKERIEQAKKEAEAKIEQEMAAAAENLDEQKIEKAAEAIADTKKSPTKEQKKGNDPSVAEEMSNMISDSVEDAVDTVKAVASVVSTKVKEAVDDFVKGDEEVIEEAEAAAEERVKKDLTIAEEVRAEEEATEITDPTTDVEEKVEQVVAKVKEQASEIAESTAEKAEEVIETVEEKAESIADAIEDAVEEVKEDKDEEVS